MNINQGLKVIEFSSGGCASCYSLTSVLNKVVSKYKNVEFCYIEISKDNVNLQKKYKIDRYPTILVLSSGIELGRCVGYQPKEIFEIWLDSKLEKGGSI